MTRMMSTMTLDESVSMFPEERASSPLSSKRTQIITTHWQKFRQQSGHAQACGMRNETGSIWLCPQVPKKEPPYGSTRPKIRRDYDQGVQDLANCCQLAHCMQRDRLFAGGRKAAASTRSDNSTTKRERPSRPHGCGCQR